LKKQNKKKKITKQGGATNFRDAVLASKERGRSALFAYTQDKKMEAVRVECEAEADRAIKALLDELEATRAQIARDSRAARETGMRRADQSQDTSAIKSQISLLQQKLIQMTERSMQVEQELQAFVVHEPVFHRLAEGYDFGTPVEVIRLLEGLERDKMDKFSEVLEIKEMCKQRAAEIEAFKAHRETDYASRTADLTAARTRSERSIEQLARDVASTRVALERAYETKAKYKTLTQAVTRLYRDWEHSGDVGNSDPPDLDKPINTIQSFRKLFAAHPPNQTSLQLRALSTLGNALVMRYFNGDPTLLFRPRELYSALAATLASRTEQAEHATLATSRLTAHETKLTSQLDIAVRRGRRARTELARWRGVYESTFPAAVARLPPSELGGRFPTAATEPGAWDKLLHDVAAADAVAGDTAGDGVGGGGGGGVGGGDGSGAAFGGTFGGSGMDSDGDFGDGGVGAVPIDPEDAAKIDAVHRAFDEHWQRLSSSARPDRMELPRAMGEMASRASQFSPAMKVLAALRERRRKSHLRKGGPLVVAEDNTDLDELLDRVERGAREAEIERAEEARDKLQSAGLEAREKLREAQELSRERQSALRDLEDSGSGQDLDADDASADADF
jgi:hypothetical protein